MGEVFWAATWIFGDDDEKDERPVVVVRAPRHIADVITVIERSTSRFDLRGLEHEVDLMLGLDKRGIWVLRFTRTVNAALFREPNVRAVGRLADEILDRLIEMWEKW